MSKDIAKMVTIKNGKVEEKMFIPTETRDESFTIQDMYEEADKKINEEYMVLVAVKSQPSYDKNEYNRYELSIPNEVKPTDYLAIMPLVKQITNKGKTIDIINNCIRNGYQDYDLHSGDFEEYEIDQNLSYRHRKMLEKENNDRNQFAMVDLFIRKKLNGLTEHEEKIYREYEEFDLERILYEDNTKYALNNGNGAVITIFPDKTYESNTTKIEHSYEHDQHLKAYKEETGSYCPNNIYIQLSTKRAVCWIPTEINEYQLQQLDNLMDKINELDLVRGKVDVDGAKIIGDSATTNINIVEEFQGTQEIKEHISKARGSSQK